MWLQQPTLNTTGAVPVTDHRPLHQRVWEVEREREHKLRLLVADKEEREGATFAPPPMGRVSERLADTRPAFAGEGGGGACGEGGGRSATRLQEQAMWARERRRLRVQEHEEVSALWREGSCARAGNTLMGRILAWVARGGRLQGMVFVCSAFFWWSLLACLCSCSPSVAFVFSAK